MPINNSEGKLYGHIYEVGDQFCTGEILLDATAQPGNPIHDEEQLYIGKAIISAQVVDFDDTEGWMELYIYSKVFDATGYDDYYNDAGCTVHTMGLEMSIEASDFIDVEILDDYDECTGGKNYNPVHPDKLDYTPQEKAVDTLGTLLGMGIDTATNGVLSGTDIILTWSENCRNEIPRYTDTDECNIEWWYEDGTSECDPLIGECTEDENYMFTWQRIIWQVPKNVDNTYSLEINIRPKSMGWETVDEQWKNPMRLIYNPADDGDDGGGGGNPPGPIPTEVGENKVNVSNKE